MKHIITVISMMFAMTTTSFFSYAQSTFSGGSGTSADPFLISSVEDLQQLATDVNNKIFYEDSCFKLTADLDLSSVCGSTLGNWVPIGTGSEYWVDGGEFEDEDWDDTYEKISFKGIFDGNGHIVYNLYINTFEEYQGLFGYLKGTIKNLGVFNSNVTGYFYVGGICGESHGTISNCFHLGYITGTGRDIGGICGHNGGTISNCYNAGSVTGIYAGGISGVDGTIKNSYNTAYVSGSESGVSSLYGSPSNCYYDKQNCIAGGKSGKDESGSAEGKLTSELTSGSFFNDATVWVETAGMYPRLKGLEATDAAILSATPIFLSSIDSDEYEAVDSVISDFTVGTANNVVWTNSQGKVTINGSNALIAADGIDTLTATLGNVSKKIVVDVYIELGKSLNPFIIDEVSDLQSLSTGINSGVDFPYWNDSSINIPSGGVGKYFKLTADIDLSSVCGPTLENWAPIGTDTTSFKGNFDGNEHTISNLYIDDTSSNQGLFGVIDASYISNLGVIGNIVNSANNVGLLCGKTFYSNIINCYSKGQVNSVGGSVGGFCGYVEFGSISRCYNSADVNSEGNTGGICGYNNGGMLSDNYNT